jgi:RNA 2',3'-cyclic 3'-phosphodiesterase
MRLFLALELAGEVLDALEHAVAPVREAFPELAWVRPEKRHLTLKFLGDTAPERVDSLRVACDEVAKRNRAFAMHVEGVGAFPNFRRARVLWTGVDQEPRLELLHHDVEVAGEVIGFEIEGRAFRPHITLARIRAPLDAERHRQLAKLARRVDFSATVPVTEITLFESTLAQGGSQYRRLHVASLQGGR